MKMGLVAMETRTSIGGPGGLANSVPDLKFWPLYCLEVIYESILSRCGLCHSLSWTYFP